MKTCLIYGDLTSDRASEQYVTVNLCDDCLAAEERKGENSSVVSVLQDYDPDFGQTCAFCDTPKD